MALVHSLSDPLQAKYGPFKITEEDGKPNTHIELGPIVTDPHVLKSIRLYKEFGNNSFIGARLVSDSNIGRGGILSHTCSFALVYSIKPPPAPPPPARLGPQGF